MAEASRIVLDGFETQTDVEIVRYPDRYHDKRGVVLWDKMMKLLDVVEAEQTEELKCAVSN